MKMRYAGNSIIIHSRIVTHCSKHCNVYTDNIKIEYKCVYCNSEIQHEQHQHQQYACLCYGYYHKQCHVGAFNFL